MVMPIASDKNKNEYPSRWQIQYFQHNTNELQSPPRKPKYNSKDQTISFPLANSKNKAELEYYAGMYKFKVEGERYPFYRIGPNKWKRADKLSTFGTNEYDINTSNDSIVTILKSKEEKNDLIEKGIEDKYAGMDSSSASDEKSSAVNTKNHIKDGNLQKSLDSIANANLGNLSYLAKTLNQILPDNIKLVIRDLTKYKAAGAYLNDTIYIDPKFLNTNDENTVAEKLIHELIHAVTETTLEKYVEIEQDGRANLKSVPDIPKPVRDLVTVFNYARDKFEGNNPGVIASTIVKRDNFQGLKDNEYTAYGLTNLKEFLSLLSNDNFRAELDKMGYKNSGLSYIPDFLLVFYPCTHHHTKWFYYWDMQKSYHHPF